MARFCISDLFYVMYDVSEAIRVIRVSSITLDQIDQIELASKIRRQCAAHNELPS